MVADWEGTVKADIKKAGDMLKTPNLSSKLLEAWQAKLTRKQQELEGKEGRVNMFGLTVGREIDNEVGAEAREHYAAVLLLPNGAGFSSIWSRRGMSSRPWSSLIES